MKTKIDWKSEAVKELAKRSIYVVAFGALFLMSGLISQFRSNLNQVDKVVLVVAIVTWAILVVLDVFVLLRGSKFLILGLASHGAILAAFCWMTIRADSTALRSNIPVYTTLLLLLFSKLLQSMLFQYGFINETRRASKVGFAATGIVIGNAAGAHPYFYLVLNKNLRGGKGLWVPPGGHFTPQIQNPIEVLISKVKAEIGVNCRVYYPYGPDELKQSEELRTEGGEWITPPVFVLKEDMGGVCSHGHSMHLDFLYLCLTDGQIVEKNHKYDKNQIQIPLEHCSDFHATERIIGDTIDNWYVKNFGRKPSTREDLTKDVTWRIFLAAKIFNEHVPAK